VEGAGETRLSGIDFQNALPLPDGRWLVFSRQGQVLLFDPARSLTETRLVRLNISPGAAVTDPLLVAGGLLVPTKTGQIALLSLDSGDNLVLPFHPQLRAGVEINWQRPALSSADEFVIADDQLNIYRIGIVETGGAHLEALEQVAVPEQITSPLAVLDNNVFAAIQRSDSDAILCFSLPRLREEANVPLKGRVTWGPERVGNVVLVATDAEGLVAFDGQRQQMWNAPLPYGPLAGSPLVVDGDWILASKSGVLWRIGSADGKELAHTEINEPLGGGPVRAGDRLWVPGADGTLYRVPMLTPQN
jgi:hypothetical protein